MSPVEITIASLFCGSFLHNKTEDGGGNSRLVIHSLFSMAQDCPRSPTFARVRRLGLGRWLPRDRDISQRAQNSFTNNPSFVGVSYVKPV